LKFSSPSKKNAVNLLLATSTYSNFFFNIADATLQQTDISWDRVYPEKNNVQLGSQTMENVSRQHTLEQSKSKYKIEKEKSEESTIFIKESFMELKKHETIFTPEDENESDFDSCSSHILFDSHIDIDLNILDDNSGTKNDFSWQNECADEYWI
jgi:hypothetical protein